MNQIYDMDSMITPLSTNSVDSHVVDYIIKWGSLMLTQLSLPL